MLQLFPEPLGDGNCLRATESGYMMEETETERMLPPMNT